MRSNPCLEAVTAELDRVGVRYAISVSGHVFVRWQHGGSMRRIVVSATPSSNHARWKARGDVRRMLRRDGLIGH
jgi:hypothetical protein